MKKITSKISYVVPHWPHCNSDNFDIDGKSKARCRFCISDKSGTHCLLYNEYLAVKGDLICKTRACEKATAGFESTIDTERMEATVTVPPKELIKHALNTYLKTRTDLINQGYPTAIAEKAAKDYVLGDGN